MNDGDDVMRDLDEDRGENSGDEEERGSDGVEDMEDDALSSLEFDEKPELPKSVAAWRTANAKKPQKGKKNLKKRNDISPPLRDFVSPNPFDIDTSKRMRNE
jgi:hypothetical protein